MSKELFDKLFEPFDDSEIEWAYAEPETVEATRNHLIFPFVKATSVRKRLDSVLGVQNWSTEVSPAPGGMICKLSVRIGGEWVSKSDAATETNISPVSGASTRAFVRAAAALGVGRYLYEQSDYFAHYVEKSQPGARELYFGNEIFYHLPPRLSAAPVQSAPVVPAEPARPRFRPDVTGKPRIDESPLGTKKQIDQLKSPETPSVSYLPQVKSARSTALSAQSGAAQGPSGDPQAGPDSRPHAYEKIKFGKTKGKAFRDHSQSEIEGLIRYLTIDVPNPTSKAVIVDKRKLTAFLGGKLALPQQSG